jgi:multidrug efflux pump
VRAIDEAKQELGLPTSIDAGFQGTAKAFQASLANEPILMLAALVTVYIVLGVLYESYIAAPGAQTASPAKCLTPGASWE